MSRKFSVILGNPPYQNNKNSQFYVLFIEKALNLISKSGHIIMVTPNRFLLPTSDAYKTLYPVTQWKKTWCDLKNYFPNVGQTIGAFSVEYTQRQHKGLVRLVLRNNMVIDVDISTPVIPSRSTTPESIEKWFEVMSQPSFHFIKKEPTHDSYVFLCRQWKSNNGRIYFDAEVGPSKSTEKRDGRYIETIYPEEICHYLRTTDYAPVLHSFFGDQMNIVPFLWNYIPSPDIYIREDSLSLNPMSQVL